MLLVIVPESIIRGSLLVGTTVVAVPVKDLRHSDPGCPAGRLRGWHGSGSWIEDCQTHRRVSRRVYLVGLEGLGSNMGCRSSLMGPGNPATSLAQQAQMLTQHRAPSSCGTPQRDDSTPRRGHPSKTSPRWGSSTVGQNCLNSVPKGHIRPQGSSERGKLKIER